MGVKEIKIIIKQVLCITNVDAFSKEEIQP